MLVPHCVFTSTATCYLHFALQRSLLPVFAHIPRLQASLLKLYELTAIASAAVGEPQPQLMELLAALAAEVAPGSSEHLFWAQQCRCVWSGSHICGI